MPANLYLRPEDMHDQIWYACVVVNQFYERGYAILTGRDLLFLWRAWLNVGVRHVFVQPVDWPEPSTAEMMEG